MWNCCDCVSLKEHGPVNYHGSISFSEGGRQSFTIFLLLFLNVLLMIFSSKNASSLPSFGSNNTVYSIWWSKFYRTCLLVCVCVCERCTHECAYHGRMTMTLSMLPINFCLPLFDVEGGGCPKCPHWWRWSRHRVVVEACCFAPITCTWEQIHRSGQHNNNNMENTKVNNSTATERLWLPRRCTNGDREHGRTGSIIQWWHYV